MNKRRMPAEERKKVIIRAAIDVFSESNYQSAKVSDIANRSGVTDPMIYKFFDSKLDLFLEILDVTSSRTLKYFIANIDFELDNLQTIHDLKHVITKSVTSYLTSMRRYRKEIKIYYQAISEIDNPKVNEIIRNAYSKYAQFYQSVFKEAIDRKILPRDYNYNSISWDIVGFSIQQSTLFLLDFYDENDALEFLEQRINTWV